MTIFTFTGAGLGCNIHVQYCINNESPVGALPDPQKQAGVMMQAEWAAVVTMSAVSAYFIWRARHRFESLKLYSCSRMTAEEVSFISVPIGDVERQLLAVMEKYVRDSHKGISFPCCRHDGASAYRYVAGPEPPEHRLHDIDSAAAPVGLWGYL